MCRLIKVAGDSLFPEYKEGDFVLVSKIPFLFRHPRPGDIVVFRLPDYGTLIKKIYHVESDTGAIEVRGTTITSIDSRVFGPIPNNSLLGKVVWHITRP
jgi:nickel-type superoxide dismutase maturation protease